MAKIKLLMTIINMFLLTTVLIYAGQLELNYFNKYEDAHAELIREHERQNYVAQCISYNMTLLKQTDAFRAAWVRSEQENNKLLNKYNELQANYIFLIKTLENVDSEVFNEVVKRVSNGKS